MKKKTRKTKKPGGCILASFIVPSKLEIQCKKDVYFSIQLDYVH